MKYEGTLIAVKDIKHSKEFYCNLFGLKISEDFGANIMLSNCIALQTLETWQEFIQKPESDIHFKHNSAEFYFEETDMDSFIKKLKAYPDIKYVHLLKEHSWGQRVIRFYDPDGHIIEVGENIAMVIRRFSESGMTPREIALRMDVSLDYVIDHLNRI
ncbi:MAG: VOC family protein [Lachnospiraceae bacterium]|nr:VOC family protein [Lachnospiraceae bacterium]